MPRKRPENRWFQLSEPEAETLEALASQEADGIAEEPRFDQESRAVKQRIQELRRIARKLRDPREEQ